MPEHETTCPYGADSDIPARYLAGTLSVAEIDEFEEHYFACDRCFDAVRKGAEIRAAMAAASSGVSIETPPDVTPILRQGRKISVWQPVLAAAAVVIVVLGVRKAVVPGAVTEPATPPPSMNAPRGSTMPFTLSSHATSTALAVAWLPLPAANSYRVRLVSSDGSLLFERETADTAILLPRDIVRDKNTVYWQVQALDALRSVVATSPVVQAQTSPGPP